MACGIWFAHSLMIYVGLSPPWCEPHEKSKQSVSFEATELAKTNKTQRTFWWGLCWRNFCKLRSSNLQTFTTWFHVECLLQTRACTAIPACKLKQHLQGSYGAQTSLTSGLTWLRISEFESVNLEMAIRLPGLATGTRRGSGLLQEMAKKNISLHVQTQPWSTVRESQPLWARQRSWPARIWTCQSRNHRNTAAVLISIVQSKEPSQHLHLLKLRPWKLHLVPAGRNFIFDSWSWKHCQQVHTCSSSEAVATVSWMCPLQNCMEKCKWASFKHVLQATLCCSRFGLRTACWQQLFQISQTNLRHLCFHSSCTNCILQTNPKNHNHILQGSIEHVREHLHN